MAAKEIRFMPKRINLRKKRKQSTLIIFVIALLFVFALSTNVFAKVLNLGTPTDSVYVQGNLGVGTSAPTAKLNVSGDAKIDNWYYKDNAFCHTDAGYATHVYYVLLADETNNDKIFGQVSGYRGGATSGSRASFAEFAIDTSSAYTTGAAITRMWNQGTGSGVSLAKVTYNGHNWWALKLNAGSAWHSQCYDFVGIRVISDTTDWMRNVRDDDVNLTAVLETRDYRSLDYRLFVDNANNVGVNTTAPTQKLHVNGAAQLDAVSYGVTPGESQTLALSTVEYVNSKVGGSGGVASGTTGQTLRHNGTSWIANSVLYNNGTNVGIGTTNPLVKFVISDTSPILRIIDSDASNYSQVSSRIELGHNGTQDVGVIGYEDSISEHFSINAKGGSSAIKLLAGNLERMRITSNGNVGIGLSSPGVRLDVGSISDAYNNSIRVRSADTYNAGFEAYGSSQGTGFLFVGQSASYGGGIFYNGDGNPAFAAGESSDRISFYRMTNGTKEVVFNYAHNSNDVNFRGGVDVAGSADLGAASFGVTPGTTQTLALTTVEYVDNAISGVNNSTVGYWTADGNNIFNSNIGNVGIGTSNPLQQLHITENLRLEGTTFAAQNGVIYKGGSKFIHDFNYGDNGVVTTYGENLFIGIESGNFTMGSTATDMYQASFNTAIGAYTLFNNTLGRNNTVLGGYALRQNTSGSNNTAVGNSALIMSDTGVGNVAIGSGALMGNITGSRNTALGTDAGAFSDGFLDNSSASDSIFIGFSAYALADGQTNQVVIGSEAIGAGSNSVVLGNDSITKTILKGNVGIGTTGPSFPLDVVGSIRSTGFGTALRVAGGNSDVPLFRVDASSGVSDSANYGFSLKYVGTRGGNANSLSLFSDNITGTQVEALTVYQNGYVGIGVTNPIYRLDVGGSAQLGAISFGVTPGSSQDLALATVEYVNNSVSASGGLWSENGTSVYYNNGNIGIGTSAPTGRLDVANASQIFLGGASATLRLTSTANTMWLQGLNAARTGTVNNIAFSGNGGANRTLDIDLANQRVGIGTSAPGSKLHVHALSGTSDRELLFKGSISDAADDAFFVTNGTTLGGVFVPSFAGFANTSNDRWSLNFRGLVTSANDASDSSSYGLVDFSTYRTSSSVDPLNGTLSSIVNRKLFTFRNNTSFLLTILASGNVGIATTNPGTKLDVNGSFKTTSATVSNLAGSGNTFVMTDNSGNLYTQDGITFKRTAVSDADYSAQASDYIIAYTSLSGNRTLTLPTSVCTSGRAYIIVNETGGAYNVVVDPESTATISGMTSISLPAYNSIPVYCNGTNWFIY